MTPLAARLSRTPANQNPWFNKKVFYSLPAVSQIQVANAAAEVLPSTLMDQGAPAEHIGAVINGTGATPTGVSPVPGGIVPTTNVGAANPPQSPTFHPAPNNPMYTGWETRGDLNPIGSLQRRPWPVHILPATSVATAGGTGTFSLTPQEDFQVFRVIMPSQTSSGGGYITSLSVGTRLINVAAGSHPFNCFSEKTDAPRLDFPLCRAGQTISIQYSGAGNATVLYCVLLGFGVGSAKTWRMLRSARMGTLPFGTTTIAASGTATISVQPQERFKMRRFVLNDSATNFANLTITSIAIGTMLEQAAQVAYPAGIYSTLAQDDWIDFDVCSKTSTIAVTVANGNTSQSAVFEGFATGDVWYEDEMRFAA